MTNAIKVSTILIVTALVLPAVTGCKSCDGGACAITASETGKTSCKTSKCEGKTPGGACPEGKAASACKGDACKPEKSEVSTSALKTLLDAKTPLVILDARTGKYDDGRRIAGAGQLSAEASAEEIVKSIPSKETLIVTYCSNLKCQASANLAGALRKQGYKNVLEYSAGIAGWVEAGNEVTETGKQN